MSGKTAQQIQEKPRTDDVMSVEQISFAGLLLSKHVLQGLTAAGFQRPSPIQLKAIPYGRCGLDLIVQAKSGTGKTCVFAVIALENVITEGSSCQVLVLAPTREIAVQIWEVIKSIGSCMTELRCYTFIGGLPLADDKLKLKKCHIAIGTPGRVKQLIEEGILNTESIRLFVLDEADKLLEDSFQNTINWIFSSLSVNKQMLALSATYPEVLAQHLKGYMRNPTFVRLNTSDPALLGIRQYCKTTPFHPLPQKVFEEKSKALMDLLSSVAFNQCLVFSNYQIRAQSLSDLLVSKGWPSTYISGSQDQQHRLTAMAKLKLFQCRVLISTDLTSRGIDAENVNLVVNLDIPRDHETYLHRIGRAGRFGSFGAAVSFACLGKEMADLKAIETKCNTCIKPLPEPIPNDLARSSGFVHIDDYVVAEKIVTVPCETKNNEQTGIGSCLVESTGGDSKSEHLEEHIFQNGGSHSSTHPTNVGQMQECCEKDKDQTPLRLENSLDVPDASSAVTCTSKLLSSEILQGEGNGTEESQEKEANIPETTQKETLADFIGVDSLPKLPTVHRGKSCLSGSLRNCQKILDHYRAFQESGAKMPIVVSNDDTLPGDRQVQVSDTEIDHSVSAIVKLLKHISLERKGLLKENSSLICDVEYNYDHEDFPSTLSVHSCSNGISPKTSISESIALEKPGQHELNTTDSKVPTLQHKIFNVPECLQTPLSIVIDDSVYPDINKSEQDVSLGIDYIKRLTVRPDDDLTSDDLTNISDLSGEESDTESESGSTDIYSLSSEESGTARLPAGDNIMADAKHGYPHNQFVSVERSQTESASFEPSYEESNYLHTDPYGAYYSDHYYSADPQSVNPQDMYSNWTYSGYDSNNWWRHNLDEAVQYSKWLNNVHVSNYANFCWQNYTMHKQYAKQYEEMYQAAYAQLKKL